jgi:hypothetical protein
MQAMKERLGKVPAIKRSLLHEDLSIHDSNLKNSKRVECDPSSQDELDIGILSSCGSAGHQYSCKESEASSLGGFCIIEAEGAMSPSRALQNGEFLAAFCDPLSPDFSYEGGALNCDCDGVDSDTMTGTVTCVPYDRCCVDAGASSFCASVTFDITVDEGFPTEILDCYAFTSPYERTTCYSFIFDEDEYYASACELTIDDKECSSCVLENFNGCHLFDCTNIDVDEAQEGNTCYGENRLPLLEFVNSEEIDDFPIVCGVDPPKDLSTDPPRNSKMRKKGKKSSGKKSASSGKKSSGKKAASSGKKGKKVSLM